ncbi:MAG: hypothetical protein WCS80_03090 [Bacilli bacterium]
MILSGRDLKPGLEEKLNSLLLGKNLSFYIYSDSQNLPAQSYLRGVKKMLDRLSVPYKEGYIDKNKSKEENMKIFMEESKGLYTVIGKPLGVDYEEEYINLLNPLFDPDMVTPINRAHLLEGDLDYLPAIARSVKTIIEGYNIDVTGKKVLIIGRSLSVGLPISRYFISKNALVEIGHSKVPSSKLNEEASQADLIVLASGHQGVIKRESLNKNSIVIDCGYSADGGDLGFVPEENEIKAYTPVPGGTGVLTSLCLLYNAILLTSKH